MPDYTLTQPAATVDSTLVKSATYIPKAMVTVADITARNAIATADKSNGKVVKVLDDGSGNVAYYSWNSGGSTWDNAYFPVEDGTITSDSLDADLYNEVFVPTYSTEAEVTQEITSLASTVLIGKLTAEVQGNTQTPYDQYTKLLMRFEGSDASTTFVDDTGKTVTPSGNAQIDTAQFKFGSSAGLFDGTTGYLTVDASSGDFNIGTNDFCIQTWVRFAALPASDQWLIDFRTQSTEVAIALRKTDANKISFFVNGATVITGTTTIAINTWYNIALSRVSGVTTLRINGGQEGSSYTDANNYVAVISIIIGAAFNGTSALNGWLDDLRISVGTPRYTSNFTPLPLAVLSTDRIAVKSVGRNLFDGIMELGAISTTTGSNSVDATSARTTKFIDVTPSTAYKFSQNGVAKSVLIFHYDANKNFISYSSSSATTTPTNCRYIRFYYSSGYADTTKLQIELGSTATTYEAYTETTAILPNELKRISSTVYDTWDANLGKHTKNCSDWVTLSGNAFTWALNGDHTGTKTFYASSVGTLTSVIQGGVLGVKYNQKQLTSTYNGTAADNIWISGSVANRVFVAASDTDTGWDESWADATSFTGMTWNGIIKAYMNGWKLTTSNTNVASCVWTGIASGTVKNAGAADYSHVTTTIDTGFTPYKMIYQLATPVVTNYYRNTLTSEPSGTIYVTPFISDYDFYDSGCVITNTSYPMSSLEYVNIVDKGTGALTPVALSTCTVAVDGLSFTSTAISAEDLVDFGYNHKYLSTVPTLSYICDENLKATVVSNREDIGELDRKIEQVITQERSRLGVIPLTLGAISATTTFSLIAPITCDLADIKLVTKDNIAANDTDYWTMELIDKGSSGSDSNTIVSKTTKVTGGSGVTGYDAYDLGVLDSTHSKLTAGDVVLLKFTKSGSATAFAEAMAMITYLAGN